MGSLRGVGWGEGEDGRVFLNFEKGWEGMGSVKWGRKSLREICESEGWSC